MSKRTVEEFIAALEKDPALRDAVNFRRSLLTVARVWADDATIKEGDIDKAIKKLWGVDCLACLRTHCVSEVPGF